MSFFEKATFCAETSTTTTTTEIEPEVKPILREAVLEQIVEINAEYVLFEFWLDGFFSGKTLYKVYGANECGFMDLTADCRALGLADASPLGVPSLRSKIIGTRVNLEVTYVRVDGSLYTNLRIISAVTEGNRTINTGTASLVEFYVEL